MNFIYLVVIQRIDWNYSKRLESLNLKDPKYNLLVIGNSLAMDGIDTKLLSENGYNSYNLAIGGSSLETNYIQLMEYLSIYNQKPKYVILGMGSYMNSFESGNINPIVDFTQKDKVYTPSDLPILKFKWLFKEQLKKILSKDHREAYLDRGQLKFKKAIKDDSKINLSNEFQLDKYKNSQTLKLIIDLCEKENIQLLILEMPGYKKDRHKFIKKVIHLDDKQNVFVVDYNYFEFCELFDDHKDWIGNSHLNQYGAQKFTKYILNDLKKLNLIN
jgi:hypothetical protein